MADYQIEIFATPNHPLKEGEWKALGYETLADYVKMLILSHEGHVDGDCKRCKNTKKNPLVSFGKFDPVTGGKEIILECKNYKELPTESIVGVLEFS